MSECASCGFENRPGALFCWSCGEQLGRACAACGEVVPLELAFCTGCGAAMAPGEEELPIPEER
jgi:adenylate cyclase